MAETGPGPIGDGPRRRHEFVGVIGADSLDGLARALENIARELREDGNTVVTGGPSWGGHWQHVVDAKQTHEEYFREVDAYLAKLKAKRESDHG